MMVLVDSSVWIDFLRDPTGENSDLAVALRNGTAAICPVIWVEIWSGIKGKREETIFRQITELCPNLDMDGETWRTAGSLGQLAKKSGLNCPLSDILITACAKRHGAGLLHKDKHMEALLKL